LLKQATLVAVLYLENNLSPSVFTGDRISLLNVLASQAAISLENTRLYRDLAEREAKIRRLVDANIIGIFIWDFDRGILEANDAFLRIVGYDREDLLSGLLSLTDLTPPEWAGRTAQTLQQVRMTGSAQPFEKEYFRKDGSRAPVLIGSASFEEGARQGVSFVLDLTERKRVEVALREMQMQLAHANRVSTMGQLTASIAHEIKQPIGSARNNARAALNFLDKNPSDVAEVREAVACIVDDTDRASDVVDRIGSFIKKAPPQKEVVDLNAAILDVTALTHGEAVKTGVTVGTQLAGELPRIQCDRVQLQQVILNLILNAIQSTSGVEDGNREVHISTANIEPEGVCVAVRDTGHGLRPESLPRLFEPFYTTKPDGMGMGLSICRSIIEAHGGRLWATSCEPRGALFQFTIPTV
jgi:PAS domain S-box-containing protein